MYKNAMSHAVIFGVLIFWSFTALAQKNNFNGDWKINLSKSDFGDINPAVTSKEIRVNQHLDSIIIDGISTGDDDQDIISTDRLSNNSSLSEYTGKHGKRTVSVKWSDDDHILTRIGVYDLDYGDEKKQFTATEILTLSEDSKTLTDALTIEHKSGRRYSVKAVYDKNQ
jgi:hypothetical protein